MCKNVLPTHMYKQHMCVWMPTEEGITSLGTRVTDHCESAEGTWELNPDPLQEDEALLTTESFLRLQSVETRPHHAAQTGPEFAILPASVSQVPAL